MTQSRPLTRLDQVQLDNVIRRHEMFRNARMGGSRATLSFFDLSGSI